jgi:flagellar biogenesis protein FliO
MVVGVIGAIIVVVLAAYTLRRLFRSWRTFGGRAGDRRPPP